MAAPHPLSVHLNFFMGNAKALVKEFRVESYLGYCVSLLFYRLKINVF